MKQFSHTRRRPDGRNGWMAAGMKAAWPICLGYIPIGLALGVLAQKAGLTPLEIGMMSVFVFAGSAQFIAVSMLSSGIAAVSIILTTFVVNLRHLLMSSSLAIYFTGENRLKLTLFAYGITDESFAVNLARLRQESPDRPWDLNRSIALNQTANLVWIISTVAGGYGGQFIPEKAFGIDYALIAMFICLLIYQLRARIHIVTALITGLFALVLSLILPGNGYIVPASVLGATIGLILKRRIEREAA
ncbi:MAG: AzlC family ABC transporter permease [Desulfococcaceae bacterium]